MTPHTLFSRLLLGLLALVGLALATAPAAAARSSVVPYLEAQQVLTAELDGDGEVLTYSTISAGVDGRIQTRRVEAQISYRYERRIDWDHDLGDQDIHSGVAQARVELVPDAVSFDAGALAARSRVDGRGPILGFSTVDDDNVAEVYSVYAGPTVSTRVGDVDVGTSYRLAYVNVDDNSLAGVPTLPGEPVLDRYDSSVSHSVAASVGMGPGELPFGWTIGGGYVREDVDRLDQDFEAAFVRGDIVLPVSPTFALTAGVGYEDIEADQQDILRDSNGVPILTPGGRLLPDPSKPRLAVYDQDGVIWDAGVIWRPSRRTELQARIGRRYGGTSATGSLRHKINGAYGIEAHVYDTVTSFGRVLVTDLSGLPVAFNVNRNPLSQGFGGIGGCVFGSEAGTGACFDDALQSIDTHNFRHRGADLLFSGGRGPWSVGLGAGYAHRKYLAPSAVGGVFSMDGVTDESFSLYASTGRALSRTSSLNLDAYARWFDSSLPASQASFGAGISASYYRQLFLDRMQGYAAIGLFTTDSGPADSTAATALVGLRYSF